MTKINYSSNIIENAYYAIFYFHQNNKTVSNIKLQKIMYFVEAYFTGILEINDRLFNEEWYAKEYGTVCLPLYEFFKPCKWEDIQLTYEQEIIGNNIPEINKKAIEAIFKMFGDRDDFDFIELTHLPGSPWDKLYNIYGLNKLIENNFVISKKETRDWFAREFF